MLMASLEIVEDPPGWPVLLENGQKVAESPMRSELERIVAEVEAGGERPWATPDGHGPEDEELTEDAEPQSSSEA